MANTYTHGLAEYIAGSTFEVIPQTTGADATVLVAMMGRR